MGDSTDLPLYSISVLYQLPDCYHHDYDDDVKILILKDNLYMPYMYIQIKEWHCIYEFSFMKTETEAKHLSEYYTKIAPMLFNSRSS